jgi:hypothetical protein
MRHSFRPIKPCIGVLPYFGKGGMQNAMAARAAVRLPDGLVRFSLIDGQSGPNQIIEVGRAG